MSEFEAAPDGQPTENIELMLKTAKARYYDWENAHQEAVQAVERAERMMAYWDNEELKFEYQLAVRRSQS